MHFLHAFYACVFSRKIPKTNQMFMLYYALPVIAFDIETALQVGEAVSFESTGFESIASARYFNSLNLDGTRSITEMSDKRLDVESRMQVILATLPPIDADVLEWTVISKSECVAISVLDELYASKIPHFKDAAGSMHQVALAATTTVALSLRSDTCGYTSEGLKIFLVTQLTRFYRILKSMRRTYKFTCLMSRVMMIIDRLNTDALDPYVHSVPSLELCLKVVQPMYGLDGTRRGHGMFENVRYVHHAQWHYSSDINHVRTWFNLIHGPSIIELLQLEGRWILTYTKIDHRAQLQLRSLCPGNSNSVESDAGNILTWSHAAVTFKAGSVSLFLNGHESVRPWSGCNPGAAQAPPLRIAYYSGGVSIRYYGFKVSPDAEPVLDLFVEMHHLTELGNDLPAHCRTEKGYEVELGFNQCIPAIPFVFRTATLKLEEIVTATPPVKEEPVDSSEAVPAPAANGDPGLAVAEFPESEDSFCFHGIVAICVVGGLVVLYLACCACYHIRRYRAASNAQLRVASDDERV